jgi:nucleoside-diphosphate-sugar epimerase
VNRVRDLAPTESFVKADLRDPRAIGKAVAGCAGVIHLGGISKDWAFTQLVEVDMAGVTNVLEAARRHGIKRVVLASSMHVLGFYGRTGGGQSLERAAPGQSLCGVEAVRRTRRGAVRVQVRARGHLPSTGSCHAAA